MRRNSILYEEIVGNSQELLFQDVGKEALDYLVIERKYDPEIFKKTEWFYLPEEFDAKIELIAKNATHGKDIRLGGGVNTIQQYLTAK